MQTVGCISEKNIDDFEAYLDDKDGCHSATLNTICKIFDRHHATTLLHRCADYAENPGFCFREAVVHVLRGDRTRIDKGNSYRQHFS